jgi:hypothetical protein
MTSIIAKLAARAIVAMVAVHTLHLLSVVRELRCSLEQSDRLVVVQGLSPGYES